MSQPAVSERIRHLERAVGTPVFERTAFKRASFSRIAPMFEDPKGGASVNLNAVYREVRDTLAQIVEAVKESA